MTKTNYCVKGFIAIAGAIITIFVLFDALFKVIASTEIAVFAVLGFIMNLVFTKYFLKNIDSKDLFFLKVMFVMVPIYFIARYIGVEPVSNSACLTCIFSSLLFIVNRYELENFEVFVALVTIAVAITII